MNEPGPTARNGVIVDLTVLRFASDLRGIPQVVFQFAQLFLRDPRFAGASFLVADGTPEALLAPLAIPAEKILRVPIAPLLGRFERFHGLFSTLRYRRHLRGAKLLVHPEPRTVVRGSFPQVVCFYDFLEFENPARGRRKWDRYLYFRCKYKRAARAAFKLAISAHTRQRALEFFPAMDPQSIEVVQLGTRAALAPSAPRTLPDFRPIVCLYVGAYEKRKNIPALLEHFREVTGGREAVLHLAGKQPEAIRGELRARIDGLGLNTQVTLHGLVSDAALKDLYARSHFLLFPSLGEGFGLPLVEAMAHGLVVCAFRNTAVTETVADAGVLAADGDFAAWGEAVSGLVTKPERYLELSQRARARAAFFSEEAMRQRLGAAFEGIFRKLGLPLGSGGARG